MLNEKDRKIRDSMSKILVFEDETRKIKTTLDLFIGCVEERLSGVFEQ